jgi:hypothetical protein
MVPAATHNGARSVSMPENSIALRKRPHRSRQDQPLSASPMTGPGVPISPPMARTGGVIMDDD